MEYLSILREKFSECAILKLYVDKTNVELVSKYQEYIATHNTSILTDPYPNVGFDVFVPKETVIQTTALSTMVSMDIKCEMLKLSGNAPVGGESTGFYMYARSSLSKTPLILANHVGIIDSGYRGNLIGAFRTLQDHKIEKHTRLVQICHPQLCPIYVVLVDESELSLTHRGSGGFGSTGV